MSMVKLKGINKHKNVDFSVRNHEQTQMTQIERYYNQRKQNNDYHLHKHFTNANISQRRMRTRATFARAGMERMRALMTLRMLSTRDTNRNGRKHRNVRSARSDVALPPLLITPKRKNIEK